MTRRTPSVEGLGDDIATTPSASAHRTPRNQRRNINGVLILAAVAREHGMDVDALLAGSGLSAATLHDPLLTLTFEQEFRLIRNLLAHCGDTPGLGCEAGARYRPTSLVSLGFALVSGPCLRNAFDLLMRYAELNMSMVRIAPSAGAGDLHLVFADEDLPKDVRRFVVERAVAVICTLGTTVLDRPMVPKRWDVSWPGSPEASPYRRICGIEPRYGFDRTVLVVRQADADEPFVQSNPLAYRLAEENCRQYLSIWKSRSGISASVRDIVSADLQAIPTMAQAAAGLHMSVRTLRRRLTEEGLTYSQLCDEVRQALAEELLSVHLLPVEQIAERLGYAEPSSFVHAFRRWTGGTPTAFRKGLG